MSISKICCATAIIMFLKAVVLSLVASVDCLNDAVYPQSIERFLSNLSETSLSFERVLKTLERPPHQLDFFLGRSNTPQMRSPIRLISECSNGNGSCTVFQMPTYGIAETEAKNVMNLIYQRFEYHNWYWYQFFLGSCNMPTNAWDVIKYKIAKKSMEAFVSGKPSRFLMIFGGSSVTAGHDNYFHESYPMVIHRRMKPAFDALGIELFVRNIAQGQNQCRPSDLCYESMGGSDPDWLGWEQSYNCKSADIMEIMARTAMFNKAIIFYSASGAFIPEECGDDDASISWIFESWTPEQANITARHNPSQDYLNEFRQKLNDWYEDGNSVARFTSHLQGKYDGTAPHGFSVWGHSKTMCQDSNKTRSYGCDAISMKPPCYNDGGPHWMSKQTARYGHMRRTFHPSAGMHMLRGETIAYNYLAAILDSIYMIRHDLQTMTPKEMLKNYQKRLDELLSPGPSEPIHCDKSECLSRSRCWTNYLPHYSASFLLDSIIVGDHDGWSLVMKDQGYDPKWGYLDKRPAYDIDIPRDDSLVIVCGYFQKDSLRHVFFYLDSNIDFTNHYKPSDKRERISNINHRNDGDECVYLRGIGKGQHALTVATDPSYPNHVASVSHVITFE